MRYECFYWQGECGVDAVSFKNESNGDTPTKTALAAFMLATATEFEG